MKRLIDLPLLIQTILDEGKPDDVTVIADVGAESSEEVPLVAWTAINEGQVDHGIWSAILSLAVVCESNDAFRICAELYTLVHSWSTPGVGVLAAEQYGVNDVSDMGVFDLIHSDTLLNGKSLDQYSGQFRLQINDWS